MQGDQPAGGFIQVLNCDCQQWQMCDKFKVALLKHRWLKSVVSSSSGCYQSSSKGKNIRMDKSECGLHIKV